MDQCDWRLRRRATRENVRMISVDDYLLFLDEVLDHMVRIVTELGDELANQRPDVPDSNSPYAILTHCLGVMEYWGDTWSPDAASSVTEPRSFVLPGQSESSSSEPIELDDSSSQISPTLSPMHRLEDVQSIRKMPACPYTRPRVVRSSTLMKTWHATEARWRSPGT
jgi:hypothetical protein